MAYSSDSSDPWIFSKEELMNSPSRRHGVSEEEEKIYRLKQCWFIREAGARLSRTSLPMASACLFFNRFFALHPFRNRDSTSRFDRFSMAYTCLFLAFKVEECPRQLSKVIKESYKTRQMMMMDGRGGVLPPLEEGNEEYNAIRDEVLQFERELMHTVGFDFSFDMPYAKIKDMINTIKSLGCLPLARSEEERDKELRAVWFDAIAIINDSLCTTLCLQMSGTELAGAATLIALIHRYGHSWRHRAQFTSLGVGVGGGGASLTGAAALGPSSGGGDSDGSSCDVAVVPAPPKQMAEIINEKIGLKTSQFQLMCKSMEEYYKLWSKVISAGKRPGAAPDPKKALTQKLISLLEKENGSPKSTTISSSSSLYPPSSPQSSSSSPSSPSSVTALHRKTLAMKGQAPPPPSSSSSSSVAGAHGQAGAPRPRLPHPHQSPYSHQSPRNAATTTHHQQYHHGQGKPVLPHQQQRYSGGSSGGAGGAGAGAGAGAGGGGAMRSPFMSQQSPARMSPSPHYRPPSASPLHQASPSHSSAVNFRKSPPSSSHLGPSSTLQPPLPTRLNPKPGKSPSSSSSSSPSATTHRQFQPPPVGSNPRKSPPSSSQSASSAPPSSSRTCPPTSMASPAASSPFSPIASPFAKVPSPAHRPPPSSSSSSLGGAGAKSVAGHTNGISSGGGSRIGNKRPLETGNSTNWHHHPQKHHHQHQPRPFKQARVQGVQSVVPPPPRRPPPPGTSPLPPPAPHHVQSQVPPSQPQQQQKRQLEPQQPQQQPPLKHPRHQPPPPPTQLQLQHQHQHRMVPKHQHQQPPVYTANSPEMVSPVQHHSPPSPNQAQAANSSYDVAAANKGLRVGPTVS